MNLVVLLEHGLIPAEIKLILDNSKVLRHLQQLIIKSKEFWTSIREYLAIQKGHTTSDRSL
jgi:hypothetical protein